MPRKVVGEKARMLQQVWRKALQDGRVELNFETVEAARSVRFSLYAVVKAVRSGDLVDDKLREAVDNCSVRIDGTRLRVVKDSESEELQEIAKVLGMAAEGIPELKTKEELELEESAKRVQARMMEEQAVPTRRVTPYYTRED